MNRILDQIEFPEDLKRLDQALLPTLAQEIREFLVHTVSRTGGHLASSLGVVELTLALHRVFDAPRDKIVWDVGHQAYVHKILTGRKKQFHTLRQFGGISGFPKISESPYDTFGVGHASTSISAALGLATARDLKGERFHVVAVIGDGALTGGQAFEGLNNAGFSHRDLIVVLNDNRMSISPNVGALSKALTQVITAPLYNRLKKDVWDLTEKLPRGKTTVRTLVQRIEEGLKAMIAPALLFERLGFRYVGPIDGHDVHSLIQIFENIKTFHGPVLVHVLTTKGKGYKFAEEDATTFHGLGSFCPETGLPEVKGNPTYTDVFGMTLVDLARQDSRIVGITAAMAHGTGLIHLAKAFPERFFDVGIAEQHAVTFGAGLALGGFKPVVAIYSTFLQRAFDQVIHDVALQQIPLVLAMDRGGVVGEDGPTHHGSFDLSYLRLIPNLVVMAPKDEVELRHMLYTAVRYSQGPVAIRYPRAEGLGLPFDGRYREIPIGRSELLKEGDDVAILAIGDRVYPALRVAEDLDELGVSVAVVNMRFVKPLDEAFLEEAISRFRILVTIENNTVIGGLGSAVSEFLAEHPTGTIFKRIGLPDRFIPHGSLRQLHAEAGIDPGTLIHTIQDLLDEEKRRGSSRIHSFVRSIRHP